MMIMLALRESGFDVFLPFGENTRVDLITDNGTPSCSTYGHHSNPKITRRSYIGEIDELAVYCPQTRGVYLIPIDDVSAESQASLRVAPVRNGQAKRVRLAAPYEIAKIDVY